MDQETLLILLKGGELFFFNNFPSSGCALENEENATEAKIIGYAECIVLMTSDQQFKINFRMLPSTFELLFRYLSEFQNDPVTRHEVDLEKQLIVTIWYLANAETFRTVASRFNLERMSCLRILYRTCQRIMEVNVRHKIICWPTEEEQENIKRYFGFPGAIGAIDGCHIQISPPKESHVSYINRKSFHSILIQGICNDKKEFIDCYVGEVGSVHDATVYKRSQIFNDLLQKRKKIYHNGHLVGDSAYPLSDIILTPFRQTGHLSENQKKYNKSHSSARVKIENTFGLLKSRFRRLKLLETRRIDHKVSIIMTACILHNVAMKNMDIDDSYSSDDDDEEVDSSEVNQRATRQGTEKRNRICNSLWSTLF